MTETVTVKLIAGGFKHLVTITKRDGNFEFQFSYNAKLIDEIKSLQGRKWDPKRRIWTAPINRRNIFTLNYLMGNDPYKLFDGPLMEVKPKRALYKHQPPMLAHWLTRKRALLAADMGTGKSLVMIEGMEWVWQHEQELIKRLGLVPFEHIWYCGPRSALVSFERELNKWRAIIRPSLLTYEGAVKRVASLGAKDMPPLVLLCDESSKLKTNTAQRTKAIGHVADQMAEFWEIQTGGIHQGYIVEATGTPSPKDPTDWWSQVEILCPGYLKEQSPGYLRTSLGLIEERESQYGAKYPHLVTWFDDENKCAKCGQYQNHANHDPKNIIYGVDIGHTFVKSVNQIDRLHRRLKGIVLVVKKEDCLDLPEKQYELLQLKPTVELIRAAANIKAVSKRAIEALTLLRELSDGFQYEVVSTDNRSKCQTCAGSGKILDHAEQITDDDEQFKLPDFDELADNTEQFELIACPDCGGLGDKPVKVRVTDEVKSPKDQVFIDELEAHEDIGRYVVWGGFTGTIDRLVALALREEWTVLKVDGRGYKSFSPTGAETDYSTLLDAMDLSHPRFKILKEQIPKLCFIGHPRAGGMGLTLTGSPTALFFSNDFSGEARMQAEDRIHRLGMDKNRGATIKDIILLPSDKLVLDNLKKKKSLQALTMGELERLGRDDE